VVTYLTGLANQVTALDATIAQSTRQLAGIPGKQVEFARLERKVKTLETFVAQLQSRLKEAEVAEAAQDPSVGVLDMARRPTSPIHRHRLLWTAVGLVGGMVVGLVLAFGLEYLDETVHSRGDVMVATGTPVVGLVPKIKRRQKTLLIAPSGGAATGGRLRRSRPTGRGRPGKTVTPRKQLSSPAQREQVEMLAEAYDQIETNIALTYPTREMKLLLVTSPLPGDGKTTSAVNLALSLAQRGERVVLIDADLRRGTLASAFHVATEPGLTDLLCGEMLLESVLRSQPLAGDRALYFMTTGRRHAHPGQVLKSDQLRAMLERLREECDRVVIDTPPINVVSDAAIIGRLVDGVIVVARAGATPFPALVSMAEACRSAGVPVIGTVLNGIDFDRDASYDRAYQWYGLGRSYYAAGQSRSERP
jgi:capsular exopolysaccharide synthesis family protein